MDAWDRNFAPEGFPQEADPEGAGIVFYVAEGDGGPDTAPMSKTDYEAWRTAALNGAAELEVPYQSLTPEHIAAVCPA